MKFGKRLQQQIEETLPEWQDKFLSYKQLKKRLKLIAAECFTEHAFGAPGPANSSNDSSSSGSVSGPCALGDAARDAIAGLTGQEVEFIRLLNLELEKFNAFFIEKEEEYVIRLQELKERIERAKLETEESSSTGPCFDEDMLQILKDLVTFHGEMVLLENYSSLNYTGLVKILKKHDKTTGALLRLPFIQKVLHQPFYKTELLSKLVRDCESSLQTIFPWTFLGETVSDPPKPAEPSSATGSKSQPSEAIGSAASKGKAPEFAEPEQEIKTGGEAGCSSSQNKEDQASNEDDSQVKNMESIYRSTVAALHTIHELRKGSSTYSALSLPPFNNRGVEDETLGVVVDESTVSC